jgi:hypothetical protein
MGEQAKRNLAKWEQRIVLALLGVWFLSKLYRRTLLNEYGLFSWELWRADLAIAGVLVLIGAVAFRVAKHYTSDNRHTGPNEGGGL